MRASRVRVWCQVLALSALSALVSAHAAPAADLETVYLPMTFHLEEGFLRTSACLEVRELQASDGYAGHGAALERLISALKGQDLDAYRALRHPGDADYDEQSIAMSFAQFKTVELVRIRRAFQFDDLVVLFVELRQRGKLRYLPFVFRARAGGGFGYFPSTHKLRSRTLAALDAWFRPRFGGDEPAHGDPPACAPSDLERATHRVPMGKDTWMHLAGEPMVRGKESPLASSLRAAIDDLGRLVASPDLTPYAALLTPEGGRQVLDWYASAEERDRATYRAYMQGREPFFLFDASPLFLVYTRTVRGAVEDMFFTRGSDGRLLWTDSATVSESAALFSASLREAARVEKPFEALRRTPAK